MDTNVFMNLYRKVWNTRVKDFPVSSLSSLLHGYLAVYSMEMCIRDRNKPIELLQEANKDIEDGNYTDAVQKLIAANRLNPNLREIYLSLNVACSHTNQLSLLKEYLIKAKKIFEEDDELCYYLGNLYQNQKKYVEAVKEYTLAIQYSKKNGEDYELVDVYKRQH